MKAGHHVPGALRRANETAPRDAVAYGAIPFAQALFHVMTLSGYGVFRDELYYLACADHLDWGYVDHPPLSLAVLAVLRALFGDSVEAIRLPALAAGVITTLLAVSMARFLGGGAFAQRLTALAVATFPIGMALAGFFSMNAFDGAFWMACFRVAAVPLAGGDPRHWLWFGVLAGLGLQNKISVLFLGFGLLVGMILALRLRALGSRWIWFGGLIAALLFLPHIGWQIAHGWPTLEFMENARRFKMAEMGSLAFMAEVMLNAGPLLAPVWIAGLGHLLLTAAGRPWRPLGFAFVVIFAVMLATGAKPYYAAALFPLAFAAGGVAWERWSSGAQRRWLRVGLAVMVGLNFLFTVPLVKAVLPVESLIAYMRGIGLVPSSGERHQIGVLPQHFADRFGWRELAVTVGQVHASLPIEQQDGVCVFAQNYGQAGAIDYFRAEMELPRAVSGHNSYWHWGAEGCREDVWIVIGQQRSALDAMFGSVEIGAEYECEFCMHYEARKTIWVARQPLRPLDEIWAEVKRFI